MDFKHSFWVSFKDIDGRMRVAWRENVVRVEMPWQPRLNAVIIKGKIDEFVQTQKTYDEIMA